MTYRFAPSHCHLAIVIATVLLVGCSTAGEEKAAPAPTITIENLEFAPETVNARVGESLTVQNRDAAEHSVTAVDGSFDTGRFAAGAKTFTISTPGRYEYACTVHPFMTHRFIQIRA